VKLVKKIGRSGLVQTIIGEVLALYLKIVWKTNRLVAVPDNFPECVYELQPYILVTWHGQHFLGPFAKPDNIKMRAIASRSADGEINAVALRRLGIGLIRASGSQQSRQINKRGGVRGFFEALKALRDGDSIAMTADVPKGPARVCGEGIIALAKKSGRPIVPMAGVTSLKITMPSWDKASVHLPFGRLAHTMGTPIFVDADADEDEMELKRLAVEAEINAVLERAYKLVGK